MLSTNDIHWLAGFLDGEGCFSFNRNTCRIQVAQKELWPLHKVQKLLGGNIYTFAGGYKPGQTYHALHITGKHAAGAMMMLFSLLSPRRQEKVGACLALWRKVPNRGACNRKHFPQSEALQPA